MIQMLEMIHFDANLKENYEKFKTSFDYIIIKLLQTTDGFFT